MFMCTYIGVTVVIGGGTYENKHTQGHIYMYVQTYAYIATCIYITKQPPGHTSSFYRTVSDKSI